LRLSSIQRENCNPWGMSKDQKKYLPSPCGLHTGSLIPSNNYHFEAKLLSHECKLSPSKAWVKTQLPSHAPKWIKVKSCPYGAYNLVQFEILTFCILYFLLRCECTMPLGIKFPTSIFPQNTEKEMDSFLWGLNTLRVSDSAVFVSNCQRLKLSPSGKDIVDESIWDHQYPMFGCHLYKNEPHWGYN